MKTNELFFIFIVVASLSVATILTYYRTMVNFDYETVASEEAAEVVE